MKTEVRLQNPKERIKNFFEVALGYSKEDAIREANRCLLCKEPLCVKGCPVEINIPGFIKLLREDNPQEALLKIKEKNNLPAVCGRVCPQEDQCEAMCILNKKKVPINIGALERYTADYGKKPVTSHKSQVTSKESATCDLQPATCDLRPATCDLQPATCNLQPATCDLQPATCNLQPATCNLQPATCDLQPATRIAVVGSGPAGLTTAADLAKIGHSVTLFESLHAPGGVLMYGIPEFRLPKKIVQEELEYIQGLEVEVKTDCLIGRTFTLSELFEKGYKAIFLAAGAGLPQFLGISGENLDRVYSANEFLTRVNLMQAYKFPESRTPINIGKKAAVIGGGNVAFDSARCALRLGAQVTIVYRRTEAEMPARIEEIQNAKDEGIRFQLLTQPINVLGDERGFVKGLECLKMQLGQPDESDRRRPIPIKDSNFTLDADTIIVAIGQIPNPLLAKVTAGLKINPNGTIAVDENYLTSIPGVFAGGDITTGADTVIAAMGAGKKAAAEIDRYIKKNRKIPAG